jgi:hypothetical protein
VRALASEKLAALDAQISDLIALRDALRSIAEAWDERLAETPPGEPARLLECLAAPVQPGGEPAPVLGRYRSRCRIEERTKRNEDP